ncbi:MAG: methyltransferase domain-containing protein [Verrucomicrobiota bacterium]|nr:methyltransferase domain-containing protein [Verrucomicrobiota bacterium]
MKRLFDQDELEFMDRPQPVSDALEAELDNLVSLNRCFGSHRLVRKFLDCWLNPDRCYRVLDLATGAADIPRMMLDWARPRGIKLKIDAVDANASTLAIAQRRSEAYPEITFIRGDARHYDSSESYDFVCCTLALHHFSEGDAVLVLRRCRTLSNRYVLVSDLERCLALIAGVYLMTELVYRHPMTRFDARISARRAFSFDEMYELAETAGWRQYGHGRFAVFRQALWLDQQLGGEIPVAEVDTEGLPSPA